MFDKWIEKQRELEAKSKPSTTYGPLETPIYYKFRKGDSVWYTASNEYLKVLNYAGDSYYTVEDADGRVMKIRAEYLFNA